MGELDRDEDYIVNLKHRPFPSGYKGELDLKQFISSIDSARPYLEQQDLVEDEESFKTINTVTAKETFKQAEYTVIYVSAPRCHGCKLIEPLLPEVDERLQMHF